jgi:hypothetical protein
MSFQSVEEKAPDLVGRQGGQEDNCALLTTFNEYDIDCNKNL